MEKLYPRSEDYTLHETDLREAIYYLPDSFDRDVLYKCLKEVYGPVKGLEIISEYFANSKIRPPNKFDEYWQEISLTLYEKDSFDSLLDNIYSTAREAGWIAKARRKGKNTKKPPSERKKKELDREIESKNQLKMELLKRKERDFPLENRSYISRHIVNHNGACYVHPYMLKQDIPIEDDAFVQKLTKIVDCEVIVLEAVEYLIPIPGGKEDDKEVRYQLHLTNRKDKSVFTEVTFEELTTKTRFSSFLVSKGFVKFLGENKEFDEFHYFLINEQNYPTVKKQKSWGEFMPGVFLFKNGIFDTVEKQFYPADKDLRIEYKNSKYLCPSGSELIKPPILSIPDDIESSMEFLAEKFGFWELLNGRLNVRCTLGFAVAALFNQRIIEQYGKFPLLFKFGERGTGKSSSMDWFMALFGYENGNRQSVSKQNTLKGMIRNMTLSTGFPFFLDDYRNHETNSQAPDLTSYTLNWFEQIGSSMAMKSTDHRTIDTPMKASVVMTGNDKPTDSAVLSRFIILNYTRFAMKEEQDLIPRIADHKKRFSEFTFHVLSMYDELYKKLVHYIEENSTYLSARNFQGRTVDLWSFVLAGIQCIPQIIDPLRHWIGDFEALRNEICDHIKKEEALNKESNPLHEFFDALEYYATDKNDPDSDYQNKTFVLDHRHFRIKANKGSGYTNQKGSPTDYILFLSINRIWQALQSVKADITRTTTLKVIETKLQNSGYFMDQGVQVPLTKALNESKESNRRCYALNVAELIKNRKLEELIEKAKEYESERPLRKR